MLKDVTKEELRDYFEIDTRAVSNREPFATDEQGHLIGQSMIDHGILDACESATLRGIGLGISLTSIVVSLYINLFQMGREFERKRIEIEQLQQLIREKREEIG